MQTLTNPGALSSFFGGCNRTRHLDEVYNILEQIPALAKMVRIKGPNSLRDLIADLVPVQYQQHAQIPHTHNGGPIGFSILVEGEIQVMTSGDLRGDIDQMWVLATLSPMDVFGYQLDCQGARIASMISKGKCNILQLNIINTYRYLDAVLTFAELSTRLEQLKQVPLFSQLDKKDLLMLMEHSTTKTYNIHQSIFREGDAPEGILMLDQGEVQLYQIGNRMLKRQKVVDKIPFCRMSQRGSLLGVQEASNSRLFTYSANCVSSKVVVTLFSNEVLKLISKNRRMRTELYNEEIKQRVMRVHTVIDFSAERNRKEETVVRQKSRLSFESKQRFYSHRSKTEARRSTHISNKTDHKVNFNNQEEFYSQKLDKIKHMLKKRYGNQLKSRFQPLFEAERTARKNNKSPMLKFNPLLYKSSLLIKTQRTSTTAQNSRQTPCRSTSCSFYRVKKTMAESKDVL